MKRPRVMCLLMVSSLILLPAAAWAQSATSGAIAGVVRDTTGAVLPGVTVEAASPALIEKVRIVVTDEQGQYRIIDLRPGTYSVVFTLTGFSTFRREGIELTTQFTATVNAELKVGALEETVTVSGQTPVVDVQNTLQQNVLSRDVIVALPTGIRSTLTFAALTPGAVLPATSQDVGGDRGDLMTKFGIHGLGSAETRVLQDGMNVGNMNNFTRGFAINPGSAAEVVFTMSGTAETETGGAQINIVPREGGNIFSGYFTATYSNEHMSNDNLTDALRARGLNTTSKVKQVHDYSLAGGGPIFKDRLWFYTGHRWWGGQGYVPGNYYNKTQDSWFYTPDLSLPAYTDSHNIDHNLRLTWQASTKNKANLGWNVIDGCTCFFQLDGTRAPEASAIHRYHPNYVLQASWSYPVNNRLLLEAGATGLYFRYSAMPHGGPGYSHRGGTGVNDLISVTEQSRNYTYRSRATNYGAGSYGNKMGSPITQRFSVSYVTGSHNFKTGLVVMEGWRTEGNYINGSMNFRFQNGVPNQVTVWATPVTTLERMMPNIGLFAQDQWTIRKVTLNLGLRYDYFNGHVPEQHLPEGPFVPARDFARVDHVPLFHDLSPRLGASYDLFGNGKTALKVSVGRYVASEAVQIASAANPINSTVNRVSRVWTDLNGNFVPDCDLRSVGANGECGPMENTNWGKTIIATRQADDIVTGFGNRRYNWQASGSMQHELLPRVALNVAYYRTWHGNLTVTDNLAVTSADFDPFCITAPVDSRLPGGGNQICGLYDVTPAKLGVTSNLVTQASHYGKQTEVFNGVDVTINARFGNGGLLAGGLSTGQTVTDNCYSNDAPQLLASGAGATAPRLPEFCHAAPPWSAGTQVKLSGVYPLPWDLQAAATLQNLPGIPITASYVASNALVRPSLGRDLAAGARANVTVDVIAPGAMYEDRLTQLDIRLTKVVRVRRVRVQGMFDIYNALNSSAILQMNTRFGPAWLVPTQILGARLFKFGAQLEF